MCVFIRVCVFVRVYVFMPLCMCGHMPVCSKQQNFQKKKLSVCVVTSFPTRYQCTKLFLFLATKVLCMTSVYHYNIMLVVWSVCVHVSVKSVVCPVCVCLLQCILNTAHPISHVATI